MLLYYITDRLQFPGSEQQQRDRLLSKISEAVHCGVDFIQFRERDLAVREMESLVREAVQIVRSGNGKRGPGTGTPRTRLLVNARVDVALAAGADGVHLRSSDIAPSDARAAAAKVAGQETALGSFLIAASCHTPAEVRMAEAHGADFAVFAPVFEKVRPPQRAGVGVDALREACQGATTPPTVEGVGTSRMPVLALGGVTLENAGSCIDAGASGIAAIRLFQDNDIEQVMDRLGR